MILDSDKSIWLLQEVDPANGKRTKDYKGAWNLHYDFEFDFVLS